MQQRFAQISDPHLSSLEHVRARDLLNKRALGYLSWRRKRRFEHRPEVLDALARDLNIDELAQLLVTGDLTHIGLPSEFRQGKEWLQQLGAPQQVASTDRMRRFRIWQNSCPIRGCPRGHGSRWK